MDDVIKFEEYVKKKKLSSYKKFNIIYKILVLILFITVLIFFIIVTTDIKTKSNNTMGNIDNFILLTTKIIIEHNQTIINLENKIINVLDEQNKSLKKTEKEVRNSVKTLNYVLDNFNKILINYNRYFNTQPVIDQFLNIINNMELISSNVNVTQFQNDLHVIAIKLGELSNN